MGELIGVVTGAAGFVAGAVTFGMRAKRAKKEIADVVQLSQRLIAKYEDVDEDARSLKVELSEAIGAVKTLFKI